MYAIYVNWERESKKNRADFILPFDNRNEIAAANFFSLIHFFLRRSLFAIICHSEWFDMKGDGAHIHTNKTFSRSLSLSQWKMPNEKMRTKQANKKIVDNSKHKIKAESIFTEDRQVKVRRSQSLAIIPSSVMLATIYTQRHAHSSSHKPCGDFNISTIFLIQHISVH